MAAPQRQAARRRGPPSPPRGGEWGGGAAHAHTVPPGGGQRAGAGGAGEAVGENTVLLLEKPVRFYRGRAGGRRSALQPTPLWGADSFTLRAPFPARPLPGPHPARGAAGAQARSAR